MHMFNKNSDLIRVGGPQTSVSIEVLQWYFLIPPKFYGDVIDTEDGVSCMSGNEDHDTCH